MQHEDRESPEQADALAALFALFTEGPVAVLTGAGISTDSGIPDYRGKGTPPRTPMNIDQFTTDEAYRRRFWAGARAGTQHLADIDPNPGHTSLAALEHYGYLTGVITQNVDGLHARAGTSNLAELHGNGSVIRCTPAGHRFGRAEVLRWFDVANPGFADRNADAQITPDGDADVSETSDVLVPMCPACGGMLRPNVVYFGEHVPLDVFEHAERIVAAASALLIAGSSLAVNTGIRLVHRAEQRGVPIAVINRGPTQVDMRDSVRVRIDGGTTETLLAVAERLGASLPVAHPEQLNI